MSHMHDAILFWLPNIWQYTNELRFASSHLWPMKCNIVGHGHASAASAEHYVDSTVELMRRCHQTANTNVKSESN
eukprot:scaffold421735_cov27-Prasinocladus_malaysianus.AAC.1